MALGRKRQPKIDHFAVAINKIESLRKHTVAAMVKPTFTAYQLAEMVFEPGALCALRAAAPYYDLLMHYGCREYKIHVGLPDDVASYIELEYKQAHIARAAIHCLRSVIDAPELCEIFQQVYEVQAAWLKVKTVVEWFQENASHKTTRGIWPVIDLLAGATDEPPHRSGLTKQPLAPMLPLIRETAATVAASTLLPAYTAPSMPHYTLGIDDLEYAFLDPER